MALWRRALGLDPPGPSRVVRRHALVTRIAHWINALCLFVLITSGLQIFNAHPALYLGEGSDFERPILVMTAAEGADELKGYTFIGRHAFDTTGLLGASDVNGIREARGFPAWATLPGPQWLAMGRLWHFAAAWLFAINGLLFALWAVWRGHLRRDLLPTTADLKALPHTIAEHLRLSFPKGDAALHYNPLQKLSYFAVIFGLGPLVLLTGLTMSPTMNAAFPELLWLFGGRQTARTIHFLCAFSFFAFFIVHVVMVVLSGVWNNVRSMITGRTVIEERHDQL
jgi:thiosulfate reductase cytochrome b subunit